jgi:hypothetical protein
MAMPKKQKQELPLESGPLRDAGILEHVFSFLPGIWLFLGAVCREWQAVYSNMNGQQVRSLNLYVHIKKFLCNNKITLHSAVVASPATIRLAIDSGLTLYKNKSLQLVAGRLAGVEVLTSLRELGMEFSNIVAESAALSGRLNILQYLVIEQQCPVSVMLSVYAARSGSISMLDWLKAGGRSGFNYRTYQGAAEGGHLAALQHVHSLGCGWGDESILLYAAAGGSIDVVEWLQQQHGIGIIHAEALQWAATSGHTSMCKYLRSVGCDWDAAACRWAGEGGHLDTVRWLREAGCPWVLKDVCKGAARCGNTNVLDYVVEQGEVLDAEVLSEALNYAGMYNKLQSALWLRQRGADWPAELGESDGPCVLQWSDNMLLWARAEGCRAPIIPAGDAW